MLSPAKQMRHPPKGRRETAVVMGLSAAAALQAHQNGKVFGLNRVPGLVDQDTGMRFTGN